MDTELFEEVRKRVQRSVTPSRYAHSMRTAKMAEEMCVRYGIDAEKGRFAGMAHDMCKDVSDEEMLALAAKDGNEITELERAKPALLHGRAAAVVLKEEYGIADADILQAVACHTFGGPGICALAKILFAADKVEPGREQSTDAYRAALLAKPLDAMILTVVQESIDYLTAKGKRVAPVSLAFRDALKALVSEECAQ
jgi:nicotinate-nucleotide adenylyltransferase